jgi:acyl carrier protein
MIPSHFIQVEKIPLTPSGKVDVKALPSPLPGGHKTGEKFAAPRDETEKKLVGIWSEVLEVEEGDIGIDDDFFHLGGHSLRVIAQSAKIHKEFNVNVPIADMFKLTTIRQLARYIKGTGEEKFASIEAVEKREYYPLSSAQKRIYLVQQMDLDTTAYNTPAILMLEKEPDRETLETTFKKMIQRHETLRTSFHIAVDEPVQVINEKVEIKTEYYETGSFHSFLRPFDLYLAPLMRVGVMKDRGRYMLMIDMHHIITDGTSQRVLKEEFLAIYNGEELPPLKLQYKDYSRWQSFQTKSLAMIRQEEYWLKEFQENIPVLNLPTDYQRAATRSYEGDMVPFIVSRKKTGALKEMATKNEATLYIVLLALYNIFLSKICLQEDILVGTPIVGRRHADLERSIGMFVNVIALKNNPKGSKKFEEFLAEVKEKTLKAFENQDYPYDRLVEKFGSSRDLSRNPLAETQLVWLDSSGTEDHIESKTPKDENIDNRETPVQSFEIQKTKLDITLTAKETGGEIRCQLHYVTRLFKRSTISKFCSYFVNILETIVRNPGITIDKIELLTKEDKDRMVALNRQNKEIFSRFKTEDFNEDF